MSSIKIPTGEMTDSVDELADSLRRAQIDGFTDSLVKAATGSMTFKDALVGDNRLEIIKTQILGIKDGLLAIVSGDISGGIDSIKNSFSNLKSTLSDVFKTFLGGKDTSDEDDLFITEGIVSFLKTPPTLRAK